MKDSGRKSRENGHEPFTPAAEPGQGPAGTGPHGTEAAAARGERPPRGVKDSGRESRDKGHEPFTPPGEAGPGEPGAVGRGRAGPGEAPGTRKPPLPKKRGFSFTCAEGDLNPHALIRALAPQASASAIPPPALTLCCSPFSRFPPAEQRITYHGTGQRNQFFWELARVAPRLGPKTGSEGPRIRRHARSARSPHSLPAAAHSAPVRCRSPVFRRIRARFRGRARTRRALCAADCAARAG